MDRQIQEIQALATKYSKADLGRMVQMGLLDPQKAMMAGMMIARIQQQNAQPPQATVAEEVLGIPAVAPQQPQPQQAAPQGVAALPQQAPQGAGIEALPTGEVGNYAGGGIVAFADGGTADLMQQQIFSDYNLNPPQLTAAEQEAASQSAANAQKRRELQRQLEELNQQYLYRRPDPATGARMDSMRQEISRLSGRVPVKTQVQTPPTSTGTPTSTQKIDEVKNTLAGDKPAPDKSGTKLPPIATPAPRGPALEAPKVDNTPFEERVKKYTPAVGKFDITQTETPEQASQVIKEAYAREGYDPEMYNKIIKGIEAKKGDTATEKDRAVGEAIMLAGFKLMGARKGQEFQNLSEGAQEGLKTYQGAMKDLKARQEKYDERIEALRMADAQARRTGAETAIARADKLREQAAADRRELFKAENEATRVGVQAATSLTAADKQVAASIYGDQLRAQTSERIANIQAGVQREQIAALKAQGLQDAQIKQVMNTADEIYKSLTANRPVLDPEMSQQIRNQALMQALRDYKQVAPIFGRAEQAAGINVPKLATPTPADYEKLYKLPPTDTK